MSIINSSNNFSILDIPCEIWSSIIFPHLYTNLKVLFCLRISCNFFYHLVGQLGSNVATANYKDYLLINPLNREVNISEDYIWCSIRLRIMLENGKQFIKYCYKENYISVMKLKENIYQLAKIIEMYDIEDPDKLKHKLENIINDYIPFYTIEGFYWFEDTYYSAEDGVVVVYRGIRNKLNTPEIYEYSDYVKLYMVLKYVLRPICITLKETVGLRLSHGTESLESGSRISCVLGSNEITLQFHSRDSFEVDGDLEDFKRVVSELDRYGHDGENLYLGQIIMETTHYLILGEYLCKAIF